MMKTKIISFFLFLLPISSFSQNIDIESIKAQLVEASSKILSIECDFIQTKESSMLDEKMVSYGKMSYKKPEYLKWSYEKPFNYSFVMDGKSIRVEKDGVVSSSDANQNKILREMARMIKGNIEGNYFTDSSLFGTTIQNEGGLVCVTLLPKNKELKKLWSKLVLKYHVNNFSAESFEMYENTGDITTIVFKNCHYEFSK